MRYRAGPGDPVIEAVQYTREAFHQLFAWLDQHDARAHGDYRSLSIWTGEKYAVAVPGDWIVRDVDGQFHPCKREIFTLTYALVE